MREVKPYERELLLMCLNNKATEEQQQLAWNWINAHESHRDYFEGLKESWIANSVNKPLTDQQIEKSWLRLQQKINTPGLELKTRSDRVIRNSSYGLGPWARLAAAIVVAFIIGAGGSIWYFTNYIKHPLSELNHTIQAPRGSKSHITLPDGSQVWLNAGSKLKYPGTFGINNRDLYLEGEAYFDVAHSEALTLQVHTQGIIIKALGTEFNVKAYPEDDHVETTLVSGSVSILREGYVNENQGIVLQPNQRASFYTDGQILRNLVTPEKNKQQPGSSPIAIRPARVRIENNVNTDVSTSWKDHRWVFERENLHSLATMLERQYDVTVLFDDESLKSFNLTGTLEEESIEQVLMALQLTLPINFEIKHKTVYLSVNHKKIDNYKQLIRNQ